MNGPAGSTVTIRSGYGGRRWWLVRIHPDVEDLRRVAGRYAPDVDFTECCGCCQAATWRDARTGDLVRHGQRGYAGVLRFAPPYITGEVVAHELLHAAVATYRMNFAEKVELGTDVGDAEEHLAYIYGELYQAFEDRFQHPLGGKEGRA